MDPRAPRSEPVALGALVALCPPGSTDGGPIARLRNGDAVRRWFRDDRPLPAERNQEWLESEARSATSGLLVIRSILDDSFLGFIGWSDHDRISRTVQLGRIAVHPGGCRKLARALGYVPRVADDAGRAMLAFAFHELGVARVYLETLEGNRLSLDLSRRLGFIDIGTVVRMRPSGMPGMFRRMELTRTAWALDHQ